jgi:hypothetical protein
MVEVVILPLVRGHPRLACLLPCTCLLTSFLVLACFPVLACFLVVAAICCVVVVHFLFLSLKKCVDGKFRHVICMPSFYATYCMYVSWQSYSEAMEEYSGSDGWCAVTVTDYVDW